MEIWSVRVCVCVCVCVTNSKNLSLANWRPHTHVNEIKVSQVSATLYIFILASLSVISNLLVKASNLPTFISQYSGTAAFVLISATLCLIAKEGTPTDDPRRLLRSYSSGRCSSAPAVSGGYSSTLPRHLYTFILCT